MLKKNVGVASVALFLALGVCSVGQAEDSTGKDALEPVGKMPPIPDAVQDGVVCLLPDLYHRNLDGSFWRLTLLGEETPPEKLDITIGFHNGTVSGYSGCNSYVGTFVNPNDTLFGVKGIETTGRKCEEEVCPTFVNGGSWEEKYLKALAAMAKVEKTATELRLFDSDGKRVMTFAVLK